MNKLVDFYNHYESNHSDINEHLPTLKYYSSKCSHITEFGVRSGVSTVGLLMGKPEKMVSYDINYHSNIDVYKKLANDNGIDFKFVLANVLMTQIEETDLLMIDTLHSYKQLSTELFLHAVKVKQYIIFHDIVSFGQHDEGQPDERTLSGMALSHIKNIENSGKRGLMPAILDFLSDNPEWKKELVFTNNNGLLVLRKE